MLRFYDPIEGCILLDGTDIKDLNVRWLRSQIGYVGQEPTLFSGSIKENVIRGRAGMEGLRMLSIDEILRLGPDQHNLDKLLQSDSQGQSEVEISEDVEMSDVDHDYIKACTASYAHEFIMGFSDQYGTDVGENSMMVSGGQKQRIAIARALIKNPAILLLDEATSALDATSEKYVQESIDSLQKLKSQTTIVIAHRLSTIKNADKIAVINNGEVAFFAN